MTQHVRATKWFATDGRTEYLALQPTWLVLPKNKEESNRWTLEWIAGTLDIPRGASSDLGLHMGSIREMMSSLQFK